MCLCLWVYVCVIYALWLVLPSTVSGVVRRVWWTVDVIVDVCILSLFMNVYVCLWTYIWMLLLDAMNVYWSPIPSVCVLMHPHPPPPHTHTHPYINLVRVYKTFFLWCNVRAVFSKHALNWIFFLFVLIYFYFYLIKWYCLYLGSVFLHWFLVRLSVHVCWMFWTVCSFVISWTGQTWYKIFFILWFAVTAEGTKLCTSRDRKSVV